jgi:hypothetical protein
MSDVELTCPFCNARVPAPPGVSAGARISCPRCDEVFPFTGASAGQSKAPSGLTASPPPDRQVTAAPRPAVTTRPRPSNRVVGVVVLGVMVLMALTGLTYALLTQQVRRDHDKVLPRTSRRPALPPLRPAAPETVEPVPPARLTALGYLPAGTTVVVGLHVQELLASPTGKELRGRPLKLGGFELRLGLLGDWTGLDVDDIDHVVVGAVLRDQGDADLTPPAYLVVRTRRPFSANQLRTTLQAGKERQARTPDGGKRTLYAAKVRGLPMTLWLPDNRTVVLGLASDLADVPAQPAEGIDHLSASLRPLLEKRLAGGMVLWAAGHADDWKKTWLPTLLAGLKDVPMLGRLEQVTSFAVGLVPEKPVKLQGAFLCRDEPAAQTIEEQDLAARARKNSQTFKYSRDGAWLDVQWKFDLGS